MPPAPVEAVQDLHPEGSERSPPSHRAGAGHAVTGAVATPVALGALRLLHRIVMAPMTTSRAERGGGVSAWQLAHYDRHGAGRPSLIITEAAYVSAGGEAFPPQLGAHADHLLPGLRALADRVHGHGVPIALQLHHGGQAAHSAAGGGPVAPSAIPVPQSTTVPRALRPDEVRGLVEAFAQAAGRAQQAGFDAVEIHGANAYLVQQFCSASTNRRADGYGGSLDGRHRFSLEVVARIRAATGGRLPVGYRLSPVEPWPDGITLEETRALIAALERGGADWIHLSFAARVRPPVLIPDYPAVAQAIRRATRVPVIYSGGLRQPQEIETMVAAGFDAVSVARAVLADPDFPRKILEGRPLEILRCLPCPGGCAYMRNQRCPDEVYASAGQQMHSH